MAKKILFTAYDLNVGGIETSLITLLKNLNNYDITLVLERKQGTFLDQIPDNVKVIEYKVSEGKNVLFRKIHNRIKLILFTLKIKNKYAFAGSFATYSIPGAHIALKASKNNCLWLHANYYELYQKDNKKLKSFLDSIMIKKFKRHIYVSNESMIDITNFYGNIKHKAIICNNLIDYKNILDKSIDKIEENKPECITFVNIGRHDEKQKKLTRIFAAADRLKKDGYKFIILLVGEGPDTNFYKEYVKKNNLNDYIIFIGNRKNPYPYYLLGDAVVLSSKYEGYPVVFLESMVLNKPIISTKVSDYQNLDGKYGIFVNNNDSDIYFGIKKFLDKGFEIKTKFNVEEYNMKNYNIIEKVINDEL